MLFTSYEFLAFVALLLFGYYLIPKRAQWPLLLAASLIFYWLAGPKYLIFLLVTAASTWGTAVLMSRNLQAQDAALESNRAVWSKEERKTFKAGEKKKRFRLLILGLTFNFGILAVLK